MTLEATGTMLLGTEIGAALTALEVFDVDAIGLNCATGPVEMNDAVRYLGLNSTKHVSVLPNAGLPELVDGAPHYPLTPDELALWLERFIEEDGINIVGGCCGTDVPHIQALDAMLRRRGIASRLCLGVAREAGELAAHAWVEVGNDRIIGGAEADGFTRLAEFGGAYR